MCLCGALCAHALAPSLRVRRRSGGLLCLLLLQLQLQQQLLALRQRSRTVCTARRDARARVRAAICGWILRLDDHVTRREPPASRWPLSLR
jgi:hypothetical protein